MQLAEKDAQLAEQLGAASRRLQPAHLAIIHMHMLWSCACTCMMCMCSMCMCMCSMCLCMCVCMRMCLQGSEEGFSRQV